MPKYNKYRPNYLKLYPCLKDRPDVLEVLKKGDRKMEYAEVDLKQETFVCDQEKQSAKFIPSREDSYERLQENDCQQFSAENVSVKDSVVLSDQISRLHILNNGKAAPAEPQKKPSVMEKLKAAPKQEPRKAPKKNTVREI